MTEELETLGRKELQTLAKQYGLKANQSNNHLIDQLRIFLQNTITPEQNPVEESFEEDKESEMISVSQQSPKKEEVSDLTPLNDTSSISIGEEVQVQLEDMSITSAEVIRINKKTIRVRINSSELEKTLKIEHVFLKSKTNFFSETSMNQNAENEEIPCEMPVDPVDPVDHQPHYEPQIEKQVEIQIQHQSFEEFTPEKSNIQLAPVELHISNDILNTPLERKRETPFRTSIISSKSRMTSLASSLNERPITPGRYSLTPSKQPLIVPKPTKAQIARQEAIHQRIQSMEMKMASEAANAKNFVVSGTPGIKTAEFPKSSKKISTITATATKSRSLSNLIEKDSFLSSTSANNNTESYFLSEDETRGSKKMAQDAVNTTATKENPCAKPFKARQMPNFKSLHQKLQKHSNSTTSKKEEEALSKTVVISESQQQLQRKENFINHCRGKRSQQRQSKRTSSMENEAASEMQWAGL